MENRKNTGKNKSMKLIVSFYEKIKSTKPLAKVKTYKIRNETGYIKTDTSEIKRIYYE
jgi:hypothetical protein